jgi:hypothetical protein
MTGPRPVRLGGARVDELGEELCKLRDFCTTIGVTGSWDGVGLSDAAWVLAGGVRASSRAGDGGVLAVRP